VTHHTLVATLVLPVGASVLVIAHPIGTAKPILAPGAALAAVEPVVLQVLAPAVAHGLAWRAHALAVLAELARLVATLTTLAAVFAVDEWVL
jgi:hypothetical protein